MINPYPYAGIPLGQPYAGNQGAQYAPQGFFGDLLGTVAAPLGGLIGGAAGNQQLGQQIGGMAGQFAKFIPFEAGPSSPYGYSYSPQSYGPQGYAPQGWISDIFSPVAGPAGAAIGKFFGNEQIGRQVGDLAGQLSKYIPYEAGPTITSYAPQGYAPQGYAPQGYAPQGLLGGILGGALGGPIGNWIGGAFGNPQLGETIGHAAGGVAGGFLPFQAGPSPAYGWGA